MQQLTSYFEPLADVELVVDSGIVLASFLAPNVYGPTVESMIGFDVPNAAYGVFHIVAAEALGGDFKRPVQIGGAVYTIDQLARDAGVRETVLNVGSN